MPSFFVIALRESAAAVDKAVENNYPNAFKIEPGKWAVSAPEITIAKELGDKLGLTSAGVTHLIVPARAYSGLAQPSLWEWIAAQLERANG